MNLSLITINFNGAEKTIRLLESLKAQDDQNFDLYVIDNASAEHDFKRLEYYVSRNFSAVHLIRNTQNLGFSGGNNIGIRQAIQNGSNWLLLINNDTFTTSGFIGRLQAILEHSEGIVGVPLDEGAQTAYLGKIEWLKATLPHVYDTVNGKRSTVNDLYAIGAGMAVHSSVFEKIGYLDERYFLYFEDADFSVRAHAAGIPISIADDIIIGHEVSSSTRSLGAPLLLRYHFRNAHLFTWKNGPLWIQIALPFWSIFTILKQVIKFVLMPNRRAESFAICAGIFDFYGGKFGPIRTNGR